MKIKSKIIINHHRFILNNDRLYLKYTDKIDQTIIFQKSNRQFIEKT